ncbi:tyrosine-type recombinase/integrase [Candidatus Woesearchaeota archaeon]|nr:tyrosine-type recombinase/integrase [Candidatus Woesearchaeota archaeon]
MQQQYKQNRLQGPSCPHCNHSLVRYHIKNKTWNCYKCKLTFDKPKIRPYRILTKKKKRKAEEQEIITLQQTIKLINKIQKKQHKALLSILYLTGARESEITHPNPLRLRQLSFEKINEKNFLIFRQIITLKRRKTIRRNIPILIDKNTLPLINNITEYLESEHFKEIRDEGDNTILFRMSGKRVYQIVQENTKMYPHFFRHLRNTHLVTEYNLNSQELKQYNGWKDSRPADTYTHLNYIDLAKKLTQKK